jgi:hypothetical protein
MTRLRSSRYGAAGPRHPPSRFALRRDRSLLDGLDDDIRDHIERETQANIDRGMSPAEARAAAIRKFGNIARIKEDTRAVWVPAWFDQLTQDLRYAARTMVRQPGFTVAAVAMLAIGLGLVAGGYTVFNGLFIRGWNLPTTTACSPCKRTGFRLRLAGSSATASLTVHMPTSGNMGRLPATWRWPPTTSGSAATRPRLARTPPG